MKTAIQKIIVTEHIRKEITRIPELTEDIKENGLLHPITIMQLTDGDFRLVAGLRRIKAAQSLGWMEIDANIVSPADAEAALKIEVSENEQREPLTYSEKMYYAGLFEDVEKAKAAERKAEGQVLGGITAGKGRPKNDSFENDRSQSYENQNERKPQARDIIGNKIGMSGMQYSRAKYIADNAPQEIIEQLDKGERSIFGTYEELREKEKSETPLISLSSQQEEPLSEYAPSTEAQPENHADPLEPKKTPKRPRAVSEEEQMKYLSEQDKKAIQKIQEYDALPPEGKIVDLQRQLKEERARAATAESELASIKQRYEISIDHKDSIIESLKRQNSELEAALEEANKKIADYVVKINAA